MVGRCRHPPTGRESTDPYEMNMLKEERVGGVDFYCMCFFHFGGLVVTCKLCVRYVVY